MKIPIADKDSIFYITKFRYYLSHYILQMETQTRVIPKLQILAEYWHINVQRYAYTAYSLPAFRLPFHLKVGQMCAPIVYFPTARSFLLLSHFLLTRRRGKRDMQIKFVPKPTTPYYYSSLSCQPVLYSFTNNSVPHIVPRKVGLTARSHATTA